MGALGTSYHRSKSTAALLGDRCSFRPASRPPRSRERLVFVDFLGASETWALWLNVQSRSKWYFEPRSAGICRRVFRALSRSRTIPAKTIYGSSLQLFITGTWTSPFPSEYLLVIIPVTGAREDTELPHTPAWWDWIWLLLGFTHLLRSLSASHLLLSPFPALLSAFFPDSWASLHEFSSQGGVNGWFIKTFPLVPEPFTTQMSRTLISFKSG